MKIIILIVLSLPFCIACKEKSTFERSVPKNEKECLKRIEMAKRDISEGRLTFCDTAYRHPYTRSYYANQEKAELLEKYNIVYKNAWDYKRYMPNDIVMKTDLDDTINCYCRFMWEKIDEKLGRHFIDSIMDAADELWFSRRNSDYRFGEETCDVRPVYPGDTVTKNSLSLTFSKDLKNLLIHSVGRFKSTNQDNKGYIDIRLNVDKDGTANINKFIFTLRNDSTLKYEAYLRSQLAKIVKKIGWTPGKIRGQLVYSIRNIEFFFDYSGSKKENEEIEPVPTGTPISYRQ